MKKQILLLTVLTIFAFTANATKWRVNNTSGIDADFATFKEAHDGATAGDTIYLEGSPVLYGENDTITKQLVIIGPGYFLNENDSTQANVVSATLGNLFFASGSEQSIITGVSVEGISINANNITVSRNKISSGIELAYSQSIESCIIKQNYITFSSSVVYEENSFNAINTIIVNNIIICSNPINYACIETGPGSSAIIENNILLGGGSAAFIYNSTYRSNISNTKGVGDVNNNLIQDNLTWIVTSSVFVMSGSTDGQYQLKEGSPAIGAGYDGVDCGAFGGSQPYVLSGITAGPHIFDAGASISGSAESGLPVTLKIKTQN